jgi:hypothetical protein
MSFNSNQVELQNNSSVRPSNSEPNSDSNSDLKNGLLYYNEGPQRDYNIAFKFFEKAAKTENADAFFYLGNCYLDGLGVPRDQEKAFLNFQKGANLNHIKCINNLSYCYYNGIGVKSDVKLSDYWHKEKEKLLPELPISVTFSKDTYHNGTLATTYTLDSNAKFDSPFLLFKVTYVSSVDRRKIDFGIQRLSKDKPQCWLYGGLIISGCPAVFNPGDTLIISKEGYRPKEIVCPNIF